MHPTNNNFTLINGDCVEFLRTTEPVGAIFVDPPDNLGLDYDFYVDKLSPEAYYNWLELVMRLSVLKCQVFWMSFHSSHLIEICHRLHSIVNYHKSWKSRLFVQRFRFGQYNETDNPLGYRPLLRLSSPLWRPTMTERVESERQRLGDSRAGGARGPDSGRVPDDVWDFARVTGNHSERRDWHPTQLSEAMMQRIMIQSGPGTFVDLCAGTGTSFRAGKTLGVSVTGIEVSSSYCELITRELPYVSLPPLT